MSKIIPLSKTFFALSNPKRIEIYRLCLKEKLNITQLSDKIKQSYKSTINNLRILEEAGMIKKVKETTDKAQETFIESIPFENEDSIRYKVYREIIKEQNS